MKWKYFDTHTTVFYEETNTKHTVFRCFSEQVTQLAPRMPFLSFLKKATTEKMKEIFFSALFPNFLPALRAPDAATAFRIFRCISKPGI